MKRLCRTQILLDAARAAKNYQKAIRRKLRSSRFNTMSVQIILPSDFSFSRNYNETVESLIELKESALIRGLDGKTLVELDFAKLAKITVASALVLAAEIDRWRKIGKTRLRLTNISKLNPDVKLLLSDLGFFNLIDASIRKQNSNETGNRTVTVLQMTSCNTADGQKIALISDHLQRVATIFKHNPLMYAAMFEAAYNSTLHAYPPLYSFKYPPLPQHWWATASWSIDHDELVFLVYDQGVGIAETLPRWTNYEKVRGVLADLGTIPSLILKEDAAMIEAALQVSRTSRSSGHGQGLSDIMAPINGVVGARLRILSGRGELLYDANGNVRKKERVTHIGGTLIEWTLPVSLVET
jgi:hypothetical protein